MKVTNCSAYSNENPTPKECQRQRTSCLKKRRWNVQSKRKCSPNIKRSIITTDSNLQSHSLGHDNTGSKTIKITSVDTSEEDRLYFLQMSCHFSSILTLVDSGARVSTITYELIPPHLRTIYSTNIQLCAANKLPIHCSGFVNLPIVFNNFTFMHIFYVVRNLSFQCILGSDFYKQNRCIINYDDSSLSAKIN